MTGALRGAVRLPKLLRNAAWNYAGTFVEGVVGFVVVGYMVRQIGMAEFGMLVLALTVGELLLLLDLGLLGLIAPGLIARRAIGGTAASGRLAGAAFWACTGLGVLGSGLVAAVVAVWSRSEGLAGAAPNLGFIAATGAGIALFALPAHAVARMHEANQSYSAIGRNSIFLSMLRAAGIVVFLGAGFGIVGVAVVYVATNAGRLLLLVRALRRNCRETASGWLQPDWRELRRVWRPGRWAMLDNMARQVTFGVDSLVLAAFATMNAVAAFGVGKRIPDTLWLLVLKAVGVVLPSLAEHHASGDHVRLRAQFERTCRASFSVLLPAIVLGAVFADDILRVWVGDAYAGAVAPMRWLMLNTLALGLSVPAIALLYATGQVARSARVAIVEALANLGLSLVLVRSHGSAGVAAATAITHSAAAIGWLLPAACRVAGTDLRALRRTLLADTLAPLSALMAAVACLVWISAAVPASIRFAGSAICMGLFIVLWLRSDALRFSSVGPMRPGGG